MVDPQPLLAALAAPGRLFFAPGRVNLIGEHTDYNDGFVLPMALELGVLVAAAPRRDRRLVVRSLDQEPRGDLDLDAPATTRRGDWLDYVEGVARVLEARGHRLRGADLVIGGDVPLGAGLSSSAALELSVGLALSALSGLAIDRRALALAGQAAEHEHVGTRCGVMDQMIAALAEPDHALLIDCRSLETRAIPLELGECVVLVADTGVKHSLAGSAYNERRASCEEAARVLGVRALRDTTLEQIAAADLDEVVRARAEHVVGENARVQDAVSALERGDLAGFGQLMDRSHDSLRDRYQVSCAELDLLVELLRAEPGVLGARMTGGGFGGATVSLVRRCRLPDIEARVSAAYGREVGHPPRFIAGPAGGGAREVER